MSQPDEYNQAQLVAELASIKQAVDLQLTEFYQHKINQAAGLDASYRQLLREMATFVGRGGKRLRPYLLVQGFRAAGGKELALLWPVAAAIELYHNFALIHDDIMDRDQYRYGGPNITGRYERRLRPRLGQAAAWTAQSVALLAGDLNLSFAYEQIASSQFAESIKLAVIGRLNQSLFELAAGQLLDITVAARQPISLTRYMKISQAKTASYSLETPLQIGGLLAGASSSQLAGWTDFATATGTAFQLTDDMLNIFGAPRQIGKPRFSDIREGKATALLYYTLKLASGAEQRFVRSLIGVEAISTAQGRRLQQIIKRCGALKCTQRLAGRQVAVAQRVLQHLQLPPPVEQALRELTNFAVERQY